MTADRYSDIAQPCICQWSTRPGGGWTLTERTENCPSPAHKQEEQAR